jgi:hypothetical protein
MTPCSPINLYQVFSETYNKLLKRKYIFRGHKQVFAWYLWSWTQRKLGQQLRCSLGAQILSADFCVQVSCVDRRCAGPISRPIKCLKYSHLQSESHGQVLSTSASYRGRPEFKSQTGNRQSWVYIFLVLFSESTRQISWYQVPPIQLHEMLCPSFIVIYCGLVCHHQAIYIN